MIISLLETVGIEIYSCYLHPADLFSLSLTCHQLHEDIQTNLIKMCSQHHLPLKLGINTNYLVELLTTVETNRGSFFRSKREFVDHVLDKLHSSKLLLVETTSIHDSEEKARQFFIDQNKSSAMFYDAATDNNDGNNNHNHNGPRWITTECHFQSNANKDSATSWIDYILNRDACKRYGTDRTNNKFIRDLMLYILSSLSLQQTTNNNNNNNNNSTIQIWRWGCKHSNLSGNGVGVSGVGVMISSTSSVDQESEQLELRLTRLY